VAVPDGKLGDAYYTREITVKKMIDAIGRDVTELTFGDGGAGGSAVLPDDPDVHLAWNALVEANAEITNQFHLWNTYRVEIDPNGAGRYIVPDAPTFNPYDADLLNQPTGRADLIAAVKVIEQPSDLNLVWLGTAAGTVTALVDTITGTVDDFTGKGQVVVYVTYFTPWNRLPFVIRNYIFKVATRRFIQRAVGATDYMGFTDRDESRAQAEALKHDLRIGPCNFIAGSGSGLRPLGSLSEIIDRHPYYRVYAL